MDRLYSVSGNPTTLDFGLQVAARHGWEVYPVYGVSDEGICLCPRGQRCPDTGKHPATRHGVKAASSDPAKIAEMFARHPNCNVGLATGVRSRTVMLDVDGYDGGWSSVAWLEAEHGKLPPTLLHGTGSGDVHHAYAIPAHLDQGPLPSRTIAPGLELKADGAGVVLPPSRHVLGGFYEVLIDRPLAVLPSWMVDMVTGLVPVEGGAEGASESRFELPEVIVESSPSRDRTLFKYGCSLRAHGWDRGAILAELRKVNAERCVPPMYDGQVQKIAHSVVSRYEKGNAGPAITPEVLRIVAYLEEKADGRQKSGTGAHSRWAVYRALLDLAKRHGRMHLGRDVAVSVAVRPLALAAGVSKPTVLSALRALEGSGLVYRVSWGEGPRSGVLALRVPRTSPRRAHTFTTRTTPPVSRGRGAERLYRLRHAYGIGKVAGQILEKVVAGGDAEITRGELAEWLNKKPESLKRPLRRLVGAGLIERLRMGTYRAAKDWRRRLERERVMSGEAKVERLDRAAYEREREAFMMWLAERKREAGT